MTSFLSALANLPPEAQALMWTLIILGIFAVAGLIVSVGMLVHLNWKDCERKPSKKATFVKR